MLALYAGFAIADLTVFPPEERRVDAPALLGRVKITGNYESDFFPVETETRELVKRVVYDLECMRA